MTGSVVTITAGSTIHILLGGPSTERLLPLIPGSSNAYFGGNGAWHYFVENETPTGTVNGSNKTFVLAHTPISGSLHLVVDGIELYATDDYTLLTATLTMVSAPELRIRASYRY
ncbi:hypothetical protein M0R72_12345 [Candidatus Pacearchaeota archaeon]|nr:hypothetical protein [Candidatus Pacearchaeota archaeon]